MTTTISHYELTCRDAWNVWVVLHTAKALDEIDQARRTIPFETRVIAVTTDGDVQRVA